MVKNHEELIKACGELNLNAMKKKIEEEYQKYLSSLQTIKDEALQWAKEIKEQHQKMIDAKKTSPLPPRTPTLKRTQRKRKAPEKIADCDGKENSIAVGRKARAASQAAASKFYGQFHVPVKLRRPSGSDKAVAPKEKKRVRLMSTSNDSGDDAVSVASTAVSNASIRGKSPKPKNIRTRAKRFNVNSDSTDDEKEVQKMVTRAQKEPRASPTSKKNKKPLAKKRKLAKKQDDSDSEESPAPPETTQEHVATQSDVATSENTQEESDATPKKQKIQKNVKLLMSREVKIKMEKLSETFILKQVGLIEEQETDTISEEQSADSQSEEEARNAEIEVNEEPAIRKRSSRTKPAQENKLPSKAPDLRALTPHITGKVKERVQAVEQSLQKGYPRVQVTASDTTKTIRASPKGLKLDQQPATVSNHDSPDPFGEESDGESNVSSPSNLRKKSDLPSKKVISSSMINLCSTGTLLKSTVQRDLTSAKKLFDKNFFAKKRRSKSLDHIIKRGSHHSCCNSSQPRPVIGTLGRSRVVTGKIFATSVTKEHIQQQAQDAERKKEEERLLKEEKLNEAAKKREELMKQKAEEKKRLNEERRNKVKWQQEQRQKDFEAQQRKKEEEKEKEDQRKIKEKEERAQRLLEMKQKRAEKKKLEDAKKAKEDEEKEKEKEEEERQKNTAKKGLEITKQKMLMMAKGVKAMAELPKVVTIAQTMNSTFTKVDESVCKTPKATNPAVSKLASTNSYEVTPTRDELPPAKPKTDNDYGIDEVNEDDSSEDDEKPKKKVPAWAARLKGNPQLDCADYVRLAVRNNLFGTRVFRPTIQDLFGAGARQMTRRSSAVWNTPPNLHHMTLNASMLVD